MKELKKKPFLTTREILRVIWKPMLLVVAVCVASGYAIIKMEPNSPDPKNWEGTAVQELILENQHLDELLDESERTIAELRRELGFCQGNEKRQALYDFPQADEVRMSACHNDGSDPCHDDWPVSLVTTGSQSTHGCHGDKMPGCL